MARPGTSPPAPTGLLGHLAPDLAAAAGAADVERVALEHARAAGPDGAYRYSFVKTFAVARRR